IARFSERNDRDTVFDLITWRYKMIGDYYDSLGRPDIAFSYYRTAITFGEFDYGLRKRRYFEKLASKFLKEKEYDSILHYYNIIQKSKPRRIGCGMGKLELYTDYYYWLMAALDGKGQTDSAISSFINYAFQEWTNNEGTEFSTNHLFENDYHCQMLHFISVLEKKYGFCKLYADVLNIPAITNLLPIKEQENNSCYYELKFKVTLGDYSRQLNGWAIDCPTYEVKKEEMDKTYSEFFSRDLRNSFIYRYFLEKVAL
ncbi:MAG TPA: hypothetical protein VF476_16415, partial [Chitinophagaceae bacterium]